MSAPSSHYFIYTGHNSYLTRNQLSSACSVVPVIKAWKRGVRVIELDIWPNSTKDDVHVLHGRTWTTPMELITCLKSIKEHAFAAAPCPVIITLADHLTPDLQAKEAQMPAQTFGDMFSIGADRIPLARGLEISLFKFNTTSKRYLEAQSFKVKGFVEDLWGKELSNPTADQENYKSNHNLDDEDNDNDDKSLHASEPPVYKRLIAVRAGKPRGGLK